jgi:hypothetical protein
VPPPLPILRIAAVRYEAPIGSANRDNQGDIRDNAFGIMNSVLGYFVERLTVGRGWAGKPGGSVATDTEGVGLTNRLQTTMPCAPNCLFAGKQYDATAVGLGWGWGGAQRCRQRGFARGEAEPVGVAVARRGQATAAASRPHLTGSRRARRPGQDGAGPALQEGCSAAPTPTSDRRPSHNCARRHAVPTGLPTVTPTRHPSSPQYDTEFTIEFEHLQQWVDDVKLVLQKDLWRDGATRARYLGPG